MAGGTAIYNESDSVNSESPGGGVYSGDNYRTSIITADGIAIRDINGSAVLAAGITPLDITTLLGVTVAGITDNRDGTYTITRTDGTDFILEVATVDNSAFLPPNPDGTSAESTTLAASRFRIDTSLLTVQGEISRVDAEAAEAVANTSFLAGIFARYNQYEAARTYGYGMVNGETVGDFVFYENALWEVNPLRTTPADASFSGQVPNELGDDSTRYWTLVQRFQSGNVLKTLSANNADRTETISINSGDLIYISTNPENEIDGLYLKLDGNDVTITPDSDGDNSLVTFANTRAISYAFGMDVRGGHIIQRANGTNLPQRAHLQFTGDVTLTDDVANDRTIVDITGSQPHPHSEQLAISANPTEFIQDSPGASTSAVRVQELGANGMITEILFSSSLAGVTFTGNPVINGDLATQTMSVPETVKQTPTVFTTSARVSGSSNGVTYTNHVVSLQMHIDAIWYADALVAEPADTSVATSQGVFRVGDSIQIIGVANSSIYLWLPTASITQNLLITTSNPNIGYDFGGPITNFGGFTLYSLGETEAGRTYTVRIGAL